MNASNVINFGILAVAVVAAGIAAWQALDARAARAQAQTARDQAQGYEQAALASANRSASAATRSADALEEANAIELSKMPTDLWALKRNGEKFEVVNISSQMLYAVSLDDLGSGNDITPFDEMPIDEVGPGESAFFNYSKTFDSPASTTLEVSWGDRITGERSTWRRTIS